MPFLGSMLPTSEPAKPTAVDARLNKDAERVCPSSRLLLRVSPRRGMLGASIFAYWYWLLRVLSQHEAFYWRIYPSNPERIG